MARTCPSGLKGLAAARAGRRTSGPRRARDAPPLPRRAWGRGRRIPTQARRRRRPKRLQGKPSAGPSRPQGWLRAAGLRADRLGGHQAGVAGGREPLVGTSRLISGVTVTDASGLTVTTAYDVSPVSGCTVRIANRAGCGDGAGVRAGVTWPPVLPPVNSTAGPPEVVGTFCGPDELVGAAVEHRDVLAAGLGDAPAEQVVVEEHEVGLVLAGPVDGVGDELVGVDLGIAQHVAARRSRRPSRGAGPAPSAGRAPRPRPWSRPRRSSRAPGPPRARRACRAGRA